MKSLKAEILTLLLPRFCVVVSGPCLHTSQLQWPTGFLCGWSVGLEFPAGQLAESDYWREQFQTISEGVSVCNVVMHLEH